MQEQKEEALQEARVEKRAWISRQSVEDMRVKGKAEKRELRELRELRGLIELSRQRKVADAHCCALFYVLKARLRLRAGHA